MNDQITPLPESTFEAVHNVQYYLSYLVMRGKLSLTQQEAFESYTPTEGSTLVIHRVDSDGKEVQEELQGLTGIGYSSNPTPDSKLVIGYKSTEDSVSWLTTRGITKLEIK